MAKKTVNLKEIIDDINAGMHENQLMVKHELSPGQLAKVMAKLAAMGHVQEKKQAARASATRPSYMRPTNCPNCRTPVPAGSADCPKCGIVLSKYQQTTGSSESGEHRIRPPASRTLTSPAATRSGSDYSGKIIAVAIVAALVLIPYGAYRWFRSGMDAAVIESHAAMVRTILKDVNEGQPDYFKLAKKLQHTIGYNAGGGAKKASGSPEMEKIGQVYGTLLELGGLEGNLRLREQAQGGYVPPAVRPAGSKRSEAENRLGRLHTDLSNVEAALSRAQDVAAQAEAAARRQAEQMARGQGGKVASRAGELPAAAETGDEATAELRAKLEATQEKLVTLCNEYLAMVGQAPATTTAE